MQNLKKNEGYSQNKLFQAATEMNGIIYQKQVQSAQQKGKINFV